MHQGAIYFIIFAFLMDRINGDPKFRFHPVRIIGGGISAGTRLYQKTGIKNAAFGFVFGMCLTLIIVGLSYAVTWLIVQCVYNYSYTGGILVESILCYFLIAAKSLKDESMKVHEAAVSGDLEGARKYLSFIVGRDTKDLNKQGIVKGAVETVSENLTDGVVAPLICIFFGGAPLGMAYKAVNTLDSMIGYRNEQFEYFGKFAARLDDVVNFIPARISALLMILGCLYTGADFKGAVRIYKRDRFNHSSPNAAQTESVCAGALGIDLGGDNYYRGVLVSKQTIGDLVNEHYPEHIVRANRLMYAASLNAVVLLTLISIVIIIVRIQSNV